VYLDECEVHRHPRLTRVWRRRGTTLRVPAAGEDARCTVYGALDDASGRQTWQTAPRKDGATFAAFLNRIERVWRHQKDKLSNHRWWADLPALERATGTLLDALRAEFHRPGRGIRLVHTMCTSAYPASDTWPFGRRVTRNGGDGWWTGQPPAPK